MVYPVLGSFREQRLNPAWFRLGQVTEEGVYRRGKAEDLERRRQKALEKILKSKYGSLPSGLTGKPVGAEPVRLMKDILKSSDRMGNIRQRVADFDREKRPTVDPLSVKRKTIMAPDRSGNLRSVSVPDLGDNFETPAGPVPDVSEKDLGDFVPLSEVPLSRPEEIAAKGGRATVAEAPGGARVDSDVLAVEGTFEKKEPEGPAIPEIKPGDDVLRILLEEGLFPESMAYIAADRQMDHQTKLAHLKGLYQALKASAKKDDWQAKLAAAASYKAEEQKRASALRIKEQRAKEEREAKKEFLAKRVTSQQSQRVVQNMLDKMKKLPPEFRTMQWTVAVQELAGTSYFIEHKIDELMSLSSELGAQRLKSLFPGAASDNELRAASRLFFNPRLTIGENINKLEYYQRLSDEEMKAEFKRFGIDPWGRTGKKKKPPKREYERKEL